MVTFARPVKQREVLYHILVWVILITMDALTYLTDPESRPGIELFFRFGGQYIILGFVFYSNYLLLIPAIFRKKRYLLYTVIGITAIVIGVISLLYLFTLLFDRSWDYFGIQHVIYMGSKVVVAFGMAHLVDYAIKGLRHRQREQELTKASLRNELAYLRSQVNPHFLFNTLNTIYGLSLNNSKETSKAVIMLSDLMRYVLTSAKKDRVNVIEEIESCENLIEIMRLRLGPKFPIKTEIKVENPGVPVLPLILLPLVENCFKHGDMSEEGYISLKVEVTDRLVCDINNAKTPDKTQASERIGIENLKRRLELTPDLSYIYDIKETNDNYSVHFELKML